MPPPCTLYTPRRLSSPSFHARTSTSVNGLSIDTTHPLGYALASSLRRFAGDSAPAPSPAPLPDAPALAAASCSLPHSCDMDVSNSPVPCEEGFITIHDTPFLCGVGGGVGELALVWGDGDAGGGTIPFEVCLKASKHLHCTKRVVLWSLVLPRWCA